jgi:hypothetical protein
VTSPFEVKQETCKETRRRGHPAFALGCLLATMTLTSEEIDEMFFAHLRDVVNAPRGEVLAESGHQGQVVT